MNKEFHKLMFHHSQEVLVYFQAMSPLSQFLNLVWSLFIVEEVQKSSLSAVVQLQ